VRRGRRCRLVKGRRRGLRGGERMMRDWACLVEEQWFRVLFLDEKWT
jgi:hypothetical protein